MSIKDLTDDQINNLSELELLDMELKESTQKIFSTRNKFNTTLKHFLATLVLSILVSTIFTFGVYTPIVFIPSLILFFFLNRASNDKKTAEISFKMSILFYKESGIVDDNNMYLVQKYWDKINS